MLGKIFSITFIFCEKGVCDNKVPTIFIKKWENITILSKKFLLLLYFLYKTSSRFVISCYIIVYKNRVKLYLCNKTVYFFS